VPISGPECTKEALKRRMEEEWKKHERFEFIPSYEKSGIRLTYLTVYALLRPWQSFKAHERKMNLGFPQTQLFWVNRASEL